MKMLKSFTYIFLSLYLCYAVSPLMADRDMSYWNGIGADREVPVIKLALLHNIFSILLDSEESREADAADNGIDFLVKRFRNLPVGNSLSKQIFTETHISHIDPDVLDETLFHQQYALIHSISAHYILPEPSDGYGKHHSGLAPPSLFS